MSKENNITPKEAFTKAVIQYARPYFRVGEVPPPLMPEELRRATRALLNGRQLTSDDTRAVFNNGLVIKEAGLPPLTVVSEVSRKGRFRYLIQVTEDSDLTNKDEAPREKKYQMYPKSDKQRAEVASSQFAQFIESAAVAPAQRPGFIKELVFDSVVTGKSLTIVNWICPPGTSLEYDKVSDRLYRRYVGVDQLEGFKRDYRLLSRIPLERRLIQVLEKFAIPYVYFKLVANDNPYCLYPTCLEVDGEQATLNSIQQFTNYAQLQIEQLVGEGKIYVTTMSDFLGAQLFSELLKTFRSTTLEQLVPFLPREAMEVELDVLTKHAKIDPQLISKLPHLAADVVRQYAVEGYYLEKVFGDCVILAWNESTRRGGIIDPLRKARGIQPLPKIYVLHEKRNGQVVDNF